MPEKFLPLMIPKSSPIVMLIVPIGLLLPAIRVLLGGAFLDDSRLDPVILGCLLTRCHNGLCIDFRSSYNPSLDMVDLVWAELDLRGESVAAHPFLCIFP